MVLAYSDRIWNRALETGWQHLRDGDRALGSLLTAHGLVMNGGVEHAVETLNADDLRAAVAGFRYFSFEPVAALFEQISRQRDADSDEADRRYWAVIPSDEVIDKHFQTVLASSPDAFAPLEGDG